MLRRVQVRSVIKVSLVFTLLAAAVAAAIGAGLYEVGAAFGVVHGVDRLAVRVFNAHSFHLRMADVIGGAAALAGSAGVLATAILAVAALMYNLITEMAGGVRGRRSGLPPEGRRSAGRAAETVPAAR